jgi:hypothetical protein
MITLEKKVVLVRFNTDYPENSPKRWRVLVGEIETKHDGEIKYEYMAEGEAYAVDHFNAICSASSWSGVVPSGLFTHNLLFNGDHFDVRQNENGEMVAIVGTIIEEAKVEAPEAVKPVNPETELDAE